jgi:hypothetical protein
LNEPQFQVLLGVTGFMLFLEVIALVFYCMIPGPLDKSHSKTKKLNDETKTETPDPTQFNETEV